MRSQTTAQALRSLKPEAEPYYGLKLVFTSPTLETLTLRYSDVPRVMLGEEWQGGAQWTAVASAMNAVEVGGEPTRTEVSLLNSKPAGSKARLSALLRTPLNTTDTYEFAFQAATLYQVFADLSTTDTEATTHIEASCRIEDVTNITPERLTLVLSDLTLMLEDQSRLPIVTRDLYPSCSSADIGKRIPAIFNRAKGVRTRCLVGGGFGRLAAPLTAGALTATLTDVGDETFPSGRFDIQIEGEMIAVASRSGTTLTFTPQGRARAGTLAKIHDADSGVYELRNGAKAYRFAAAANLGGAGGLKNRGTIASPGVTNITAELGALTGVSIDYDEEFPVGSGHRLTIINVARAPGSPMPTQKPVVAGGGTERFSRTIQWTNGQLPLTLRREVTGGAITGTGSVVASMPPLGDHERATSVNWRIGYSVENLLQSTTRTLSHTAPGTPASFADLTVDRVVASGTYEARFGSGGAYGNLGFGLTASGPVNGLPGRLNVVINLVEAVVEGTRRTSRSEQGKAPAPIGESTADVLFGAITCDVAGLEEDGAGSITGTPGRLLQTPADVVKAVLLYVYPGTTRADFGTSFVTTRALQVAADYAWTVVLEEPSFAVLRKKFGEQGQAALTHVGGLWEYTFLSTSPVAVATLDCDREILRDSVSISRTPRTEIKNSLRVLSKPDFRLDGADRFRRVVVREDLTQPGLTNALQEDLVLDFVQTGAMANALGDWMLGRKKRQRARVELVGWWNLLAYDPYDVIALDNDDVLSGWGGTSLLFRVVERKALLADENPARIGLSLVEANA